MSAPTMGFAAWTVRPTNKVYVVNTGDWHGAYWSRRPGCQVYRKAVPLRILLLVEQIEAFTGPGPKFFVSDFVEVPKGDPFILVTQREIDRMVFGVWDEPDFKG